MRLHTSVVKEFTFEAAHLLPDHNGKCASPHGHSYKVRLHVAGEVQGATIAGGDRNSEHGMVMDFAILKQMWRLLCEPVLDHQDLNGTLGQWGDGPEDNPNPCWPTTAENIAAWIYRQLAQHIESIGCRLTCVQLWETASAYAEVREER